MEDNGYKKLPVWLSPASLVEACRCVCPIDKLP